MKEVAFYIMNSKGYYVLKNFINKFGCKCITYIVSSEDKNIQKDFFDEIKLLAEKEKLKFFHRSESEKIALIENYFDGYKFAIGWRWLIENEKNLIVFHDSLLPKYRGFSPLVNCLINGEKVVGVTALFASPEYDKGDIISQKSLNIEYPIKIIEAIQKIEPLYFDLVDEIYSKIQNNCELIGSKQDESLSTYSIWLEKDDYFIDWSWSAEKIKRFVDATGYPYDNAKAYLNGKIIKIIDVEVEKNIVVENRERHIGKVIFIKEKTPIVVCGDGLVVLKDFRDEYNNKITINFRSKFKGK